MEENMGTQVVNTVCLYISQCDAFHAALLEIVNELKLPDACIESGKKRIVNKFNEVSLAIRDEFGKWDALLDALSMKKSNIFEPMVANAEGSSVTAQKSTACLAFARDYGAVNDTMEEAVAIRSRLKALIGFCDQLSFMLNIFYKQV